MSETTPTERAELAQRRVSAPIVDDILRQIAQGALEEGQRIPTEQELCAQYGVGRSAAREAVQTLAGKGMLRSVRGSGTSVSPRTSWQVLDPAFLKYSVGDARFTYFAEVRAMIEPPTAALAAERITPLELEELADILTRQEAAVRANNRDDFVNLDLAFHLAIARGARNPVLVPLLEASTGLGEEMRSLSTEVEGAMDRAIDWHLEILSALKHRDSQKSRSRMVGHLSQVSDEVAALHDRLLHPRG